MILFEEACTVDQVPTRIELKRAKVEAVSRVAACEEQIRCAFETYMRTVRGVSPDALKFEFASAMERVKNAVFFGGRPDLYAETDGETIWVSKSAMSYDEVVQALIHEALHDTVFVRRDTRNGSLRGIGCHDEHCVMRLLGCEVGC